MTLHDKLWQRVPSTPLTIIDGYLEMTNKHFGRGRDMVPDGHQLCC